MYWNSNYLSCIECVLQLLALGKKKKKTKYIVMLLLALSSYTILVLEKLMGKCFMRIDFWSRHSKRRDWPSLDYFYYFCIFTNIYEQEFWDILLVYSFYKITTKRKMENLGKFCPTLLSPTSSIRRRFYESYVSLVIPFYL